MAMKILTVSEITKVIKNLIENSFNEVISVQGEISNLSTSPSGHLYFTLKDSGAQIKVVLFRKYLVLNRGYSPKNGDLVVVSGDITVYEQDGVYQIIAKKIEYSAVGLFYKKFEETKRKLEQEGLFDTLRKRQIPLFIKKIAVLTSPSGAAIKDFLKILKDNGVSLKIDLWPVQVQGISAINEIVESIKKVSLHGDYDLMILMRGGGSLEDLAIFNEEVIARALVDCRIPTITAIGHERDVTIVDFVADFRSPTPTAAAGVIVERYRQITDLLFDGEKYIIREMENRLYRSSQRIDNLALRLDKNSPLSKLKRVNTFLALCIETLKNNINLKINELNGRLEYINAMLKKNTPQVKLNLAKKDIFNLEERMKKDFKKRLSSSLDRIIMFESVLKNLDPENLLKKGYCVAFRDKSVITDVKQISLEDNLEIKMKNGYIHTLVVGKKNLEERNG